MTELNAQQQEMIKQVKATLAIENLHLDVNGEQLLNAFVKKDITIDQIVEQFRQKIKQNNG